GRAFPVRGPEIVDVAVAQRFAAESGLHQSRRQDLLATRVIRRDRMPADQFAGQLDDVAHLPTPNSFLKPLSLKPCENTVSPPSSRTTTGRRINCGYSFNSSFHSAS